MLSDLASEALSLVVGVILMVTGQLLIRWWYDTRSPRTQRYARRAAAVFVVLCGVGFVWLMASVWDEIDW